MAQVLTKNKARTLGGGGYIVKGTMVPSGNYVTGGEVPSPSFASFNPVNREPDIVLIKGRSGFFYVYDDTNKKIQVRVATTTGTNIPLAEHTAVAYVAAVTSDVIEFVAIYLPF